MPAPWPTTYLRMDSPSPRSKRKGDSLCNRDRKISAAVTTAPGAYVIAIKLAEPVVVTIAGRPPIPLPAGRYLYCGSARGPGGLKARISRHMRRGKAVRWHVDQLTERGIIIDGWVFPGGDECDLVQMLSHLPIPIPGFGSSDCATCRSHLLSWPNGVVLPFNQVG